MSGWLSAKPRTTFILRRVACRTEADPDSLIASIRNATRVRTGIDLAPRLEDQLPKCRCTYQARIAFARVRRPKRDELGRRKESVSGGGTLW